MNTGKKDKGGMYVKSLLSSLHDKCRKNLFNEKILIVNTFQIGEQILLQYAKKGFTAINLKIKTIHELMLEHIQNDSADELNMITDSIGVQFIYSIFQKLRAENSLVYFQNLEATPALSHGLYQTIKKIRLAGYDSTTIKKTFFLSNEKAEDLILLIAEYEARLKSYNMLDESDLLNKAIHIVNYNEKSPVIYLLQGDITLHYLEKQFLTAVIGTAYDVLPLAPVYGLPERENPLILQAPDGEATAFSYLFDLGNRKDEPNLSLFVANNEEHELKVILHRIKQQKIAFDEVAIFYTSIDPYMTTMYHLSEKLNIPVTFSEGITILQTRPGKLLKSFITWIRNGYHVEEFLAILQKDVLQFEEGAPNYSAFANLLRKAQIGWGKDRYVQMIQKEIDDYAEKLSSTSQHDKKSYYEKLLREFTWLRELFKKLFKHLPEHQENGFLDFKELLQAFEWIMKNFAKTSSGMDQIAKKVLQEEIAHMLPYANEPTSQYDALINIEELLLTLRVGNSGPKPGSLHVASYKQGLYTNRPYTFIVGLDNQRFPGIGNEDPLLLDIERMNFGERIHLMKTVAKENVLSMVQLLASCEGEVGVSYCNFDLNENRAINPSHLFLQCFRLKSGQVDADYRQLEQEFSCPIQPELIEEKDWWTSLLIEEQDKAVDLSLLNYLNHIKQGLLAESMRQISEFTVYDGKIDCDTTHLDPRNNQELTITAGKLEKLAACPYHYFLEEVLGIKPIEELAYDPTVWLDPATRGSLLHEIFEKFYKELQEKGEKPCAQNHEDLLLNIATRIIDTLKDQFPPPSERIFEQEKAEILESCDLFLRAEEEYCQDVTPLYFEYSFGIGDKPPAILTLPSGEVRLSGKIDRVDRIGEQRFQIIDYKTGSTYRYDENKAYQGGRQLQHLLYALAFEHLAVGPGTVEKSSYQFSTIKGLGKRYERIQGAEMRTNGIDILERLLDLLKFGHFPLSNDPNDCKYCKMKSACRRFFYDQDIIEEKLMDVNCEGIKQFKVVQAYD